MLKLKNIILGTAAALVLSTQVSASSTYFGINVDNTGGAATMSSYPSTSATLVKLGAGELDIPSSATGAKVLLNAGTLGIQGNITSITCGTGGTIKHVGTGTSGSILSATIATLDTTNGAATISLPNAYTGITISSLSGASGITLNNATGNTLTVGGPLPTGAESYTINSGTIKFPAISGSAVDTGGITIAPGGIADCTAGTIFPVSGTITMTASTATLSNYPILMVKGGTTIPNSVTLN